MAQAESCALVDTRTGLFELAIRSGLKVLDAMLEGDRAAICGPRYIPQSDRLAWRAGMLVEMFEICCCQVVHASVVVPLINCVFWARPQTMHRAESGAEDSSIWH